MSTAIPKLRASSPVDAVGHSPGFSSQKLAAGVSHEAPAALSCQLEGCSNPILRAAYVSDAAYAKRKFCSQQCARKAAKRNIAPERRCHHCGAVLRRHPNEGSYDYAKRRFCNRFCMGKSSRKKKEVFTNVADYLERVGATKCPARWAAPSDHVIRPRLVTGRGA